MDRPPISVGASQVSDALQRTKVQSLDAQLDDITQLACAICQAPVGLVCSRDQQGWRLSQSLGEGHAPLNFDLAFYTFAVTQRRAFELGDLRSDPAFSASPLVVGPPHFRFFAGIPVTSEDDQLLGAICVIDTKARQLTGQQRKSLEALARQVRAHLQHQKADASRRQIQEEASEQQRQWRRVFECASIGMTEVNAEGDWLQVNGSFCAILGYTESEMLQTKPGGFIHPDDLASCRASLRKVLAGEIPSCWGEKRLIHKTGRAVWCSIHVTLVRDSSGAPAYFLAQVLDISELRLAQDGWRNAELQNKTLLELPVPVAIIQTNVGGEISYLNPHAERLLGYPLDELVGKRPISTFFVEAELREHRDVVVRLFGELTHGAETILAHAREAGPETREWTWLRKDGSAVRMTVTVTVLKDSNNRITGFAVAATQAAKPNEGAPGTVAGRFGAVADSAPLGMFLTDGHGNCTYVNEAFRQITGLGAEGATGQGWYTVFAKPDDAKFFSEFQKALRRGSDFSMELRLARDAEKWVRVRGREIFFEDVAQGYVGTVEEISTNHALLEKLKAGEERMRTVVSNAPFPLALLDRERKCVMASVGWLELHHRSWHDVNSRNFFDFVPEARERLEDLCRRALNGSSNLVHEQQIRMHGEGPAEVLRWRLFPWRSGSEICGVGVFEERLTPHLKLVADADAAREAAEAASRVKSEFLADVAEELRTPGSGIIGLVDILLETEKNPQRREYLEMIKTSTGAWLKLAREIYDFSKTESRKLELEALPFNLMDGLNQTVRRLAITAETKGLELVCQTAPDLPSVIVGDGMRLFQIISHLVTFAIEMTEKGEVSIAVETLESADPNPSLARALEFHFSVSDTSGWLSDNKLADIQQVLLMVENSPGLKKVGTSLGLVLSARLVNLMGGKLWVERTDHGATFHFTAPLSGKRQPPTVASALKGASILVAEDNLTHRKWLQQLLTIWGLKPTVLEKPGAMMDVLEIADEAGRPFRFALLDAHIPDRDTFAFAAQIKAHERTSGVVPIMLLSPSMRVADESRARDLGLEHTLVKPVNANELREILERAAGVAPSDPGVPGKINRATIPRPRWNVLMVDDSRLNQEVAVGVFGKEGHRVTIARNGKEAVAILERGKHDMVLLGLDMPGENSLETLAAIRQREREGQKPLIVFGLTADRTVTDREPAFKQNTHGLLPNPIQPKDLTLLLEQVAPELEQF